RGGDLSGRGCDDARWAAITPAGGCGAKDQVSRRRASALGATSGEGRARGTFPGDGARNGPAGAAQGKRPGEAARGSGQGKQMEFVLIGRGERVARRLRQVTEHKLARVARIDTRRSTAH